MPRIFRAARAALGAMGLVPAGPPGHRGQLPASTATTWPSPRRTGSRPSSGSRRSSRWRPAIPRRSCPWTSRAPRSSSPSIPGSPSSSPSPCRPAPRCSGRPRRTGPWPPTAAGTSPTTASSTATTSRPGAITQNLVDAMARLGCKTLVIGECGHGYGAARWEGPEWLQKGYPFEVKSILELMDEYVREGRIQLDPAKNADARDPARPLQPGAPRRHLRAPAARPPAGRDDLRRDDARTARRTSAAAAAAASWPWPATRTGGIQSGGMKAEQIKATGAKIVVAPCHNCIDQLMELNKEYKLERPDQDRRRDGGGRPRSQRVTFRGEP